MILIACHLICLRYACRGEHCQGHETHLISKSDRKKEACDGEERVIARLEITDVAGGILRGMSVLSK